MQHSRELLCVHDLQGRFLSVNPVPARLLGYSVEEILQIPMRDLLDPQFSDQFDGYLRELERVGESRGVMAVMTRTGERRFWEYHNTMRRSKRGEPVVHGVAHDVTARKRFERDLRKSEEQIRLFIEHAPAALAMFDGDMCYLEASRRWRDDYGLGDRDLRGVSHYEVSPEIPERWKEVHRRGLAGEVVRAESDRLQRADGQVRWLRWEVRPWHGAAGSVGGIVISSEDVTNLVQTREALAASEGRFRAVFERSPVGISLIDKRTGRFLRANRTYCELVGRTEEELKSLDLLSVTHPDDRAAARDYLQGLASGKFSYYEREKKYVRPDGSIRWVHAAGVVLPEVAGETPFGVGIVQDITARKEAEGALRTREADLREAQRIARVGSWYRDFKADTCVCSEETCRMLGVDPTQPTLKLSELEKLFTPRERQRIVLATEQFVLTGKPDELEVEILKKNGETGWALLHHEPVFDQAGAVVGVRGTALDITERKRAEEALRASEERMRLAQEAAQIGTFERNFRTGDIQWTPQMEALYGIAHGAAPRTEEELLKLIHPDDREKMARWLARAKESGEANGEWRVVWPDGTVRWIAGRWRVFKDASGKPERAIGVDFDITGRKQVEEDLRQAKKRLTEEKLYLEHEIDTELGFEEIIGQSKALKAVIESVGKVAASDATVLLLGETGTGKELVARAIHRLSQRSGNAFIKMNCAAIPSGLLESELFGNEKGAFTGALSRKIGRVELADKGTLFLDEIGEISPALQPKLLRVLQDQEFERLGGTKTLKVNFRLIAATNRDLAQAVRESEFRNDLYYRLNVFPILLPPLRERRDDIPLLVEHFVEKIARRMKKSITSIPTKTIDALIGWNWPGNVRELENFIERSLILTHGSVLAAPLSELVPVGEPTKDETLKTAEREHILHALRECRGQISGVRGAAARLGLKRTTLQSKLKHLGINPRVPPAS